ncbi:hypothetical protein [Nostoc sp. DedQUE09]|uniref:hypothetical protein n=1 Tax=Nostoc sp. DedQUE09 TaxID=3075394 RepID=UPI002AD4993C|nr:hypothetical protein [Nostoc sp. DedQUE09]MDZ7950491.1 hypothetical protein [Nostoc sp. DedQUE09]
MDEKSSQSNHSNDAKSTDKSSEEDEVIRKPPVVDAITVEKSFDDSRDPTVQDRPLSEDLIKAATTQKIEEEQVRRKLIVPPDA